MLPLVFQGDKKKKSSIIIIDDLTYPSIILRGEIFVKNFDEKNGYLLKKILSSLFMWTFFIQKFTYYDNR